MGTTTTNYGFMKPTVGADSDSWGNDYSAGDPLTDPSPGLNGNWEKLDQVLNALAATIAQNVLAAQIPVGGLHFSTTDNDPATNLGYGTWVAFAAGRAIVGVGTAGAGVNPITWAALDEAGSDDAVLIETDLPEHEHTVPEATVTTNETGSHSHNFDNQFYIGGTDTSRVAWTADGGVGSNYTPSIASAGDHDHEATFPETETNTTFAAQTAVSKTQPSIAVYIWRRTA